MVLAASKWLWTQEIRTPRSPFSWWPKSRTWSTIASNCSSRMDSSPSGNWNKSGTPRYRAHSRPVDTEISMKQLTPGFLALIRSDRELSGLIWKKRSRRTRMVTLQSALRSLTRSSTFTKFDPSLLLLYSSELLYFSPLSICTNVSTHSTLKYVTLKGLEEGIDGFCLSEGSKMSLPALIALYDPWIVVIPWNKVILPPQLLSHLDSQLRTADLDFQFVLLLGTFQSNLAFGSCRRLMYVSDHFIRCAPQMIPCMAGI